jgi:hypothetical protein
MLAELMAIIESFRRPLGRATVAFVVVASLTPLAISASAASPIPSVGARPLRVMEFNIENGGTVVSFHSTVETLRLADPDVVGIEEAQANMPRLAAAAGFPYFSVRLQILSRYPLIDPPDSHGLYTFVELEPGQVVAIANVHLPSNPYSPGFIKRGATRATIMHIERHLRLPAVKPAVRALSKLVGTGIPCFLTGDFNAPTFHDWTPATVGFLNRPFPVRWPVSVYVEREGFRDSYRVVHPDPIADPGITWPSGRPHVHGVWNPGPGTPKDRIDLIYAGGAARPLESIIIGEAANPEASITVDPWGTDHEAVMSTFAVRPHAPPTLVAVADRLVAAGRTEQVTFHAPPGGSDRVVVSRAGGTVATRRTHSASDGTVGFSTSGWRAGAYDVTLQQRGSVLSAVRFWVEAPGTLPSIRTSARIYAVGEPIQVSWRNTPGQRWDWIAAYDRGADPLVDSYLTWRYTHASVVGRAALDATADGPWPLPPGRYSAYLLADDGYDIVARTDFTVR